MAFSHRSWGISTIGLLSAAVLAGCGGTSVADTSPATGGTMVRPDAKWPVSGVCERASAGVLVVTVEPDAPQPRCVVGRAGARLKVVNSSDGFGQPGKAITVRFANFAPRVVKVGAATLYDEAFGNYLLTGDHFLRVSLYGASGSDVFMCPDHVTQPYQRLCG